MKFALKFLCLAGVIGLFATGCSRSPEAIANKITKKINSKLDLDNSQSQKLENIKLAMLQEYEERKARREENKEVFKKMILADKLDESEIKNHMNQKMQRLEGKFDKHFPLFQDFHASLTPEQKQKLVDLAERFHKRRH